MMQAGKRAMAHLRAICKGILFLGMGVQIGLGIIWMCCNFGRIQDFEESGSVVYRGISRLFGGNAPVLYAVQLITAFGAGYYFLYHLARYLIPQKEDGERAKGAGGLLRLPGRRGFAIGGSLALLTAPFSMQCHLAVLPCSFQASLFLLGLSFFLRFLALPGRAFQKTGQMHEEELGSRRKGQEKEERGRTAEINLAGEEKAQGEKGVPEEAGNKRGAAGKAGSMVMGIACFCAMAVLYQGMEGSLVSEYGLEAAFASRLAWPTVWLDRGGWSEELQEIAEDVSRQAGFNPENMKLLCQRIKETTDEDTAREYYLQIAGHAWEMHSDMVVRQIGWDVLGYVAAPVIVPLQLTGDAYDSFTGRNYEVMGEHAPMLTSFYVKYGCWWFSCCMILSFCLAAAGLFQKQGRQLAARCFKRCAAAALTCGFAAAVLAVLLAMRGAGLMDYKSATAIHELWLAGAFVLGTAHKSERNEA